MVKLVNLPKANSLEACIARMPFLVALWNFKRVMLTEVTQRAQCNHVNKLT